MTGAGLATPSDAGVADGAEVLVVGAGPAGAVSALLLARWGARVTLLQDPADGTERPVLGEVLPPAVRPALARLELEGLLHDPAHGLVPGSVAAWGPGTPVVTDHLRSPFGEAVGLDRASFDRALVAAAVSAGARLAASPRATWGTWGAAAAGDGGRRAARVVVDATGRAAAVARAGEATVEHADRLVAVVGILASGSMPAPADRRLLIAAEPDGWWSSMVLPDGRRVAALHGDHDRMDPAVRTDPDVWLTRLRAAPVLGPVVRAEAVGPPERLRIVAAGSSRLRAATPGGVDPGRARRPIVAAGDAEMAFDPLSSFGILGAISSAEEAVGVVTAMLDGRGGPGGPTARAAVDRREVARDARWAQYLERLAVAYGDETRWPQAPFWVRRRPNPTRMEQPSSGERATIGG